MPAIHGKAFPVSVGFLSVERFSRHDHKLTLGKTLLRALENYLKSFLQEQFVQELNEDLKKKKTQKITSSYIAI